MSPRKLSIIVTCTDRKAYEPAHDLMVRNLPGADAETRCARWLQAIETEPPVAPLTDLYRGETWSQVTRLVQTARTAGYNPALYVASAGLGLRKGTFKAPSYAATFSPGHADSVATTTPGAVHWWAQLPHDVAGLDDSPAVWVLSRSYAQVIGPDLLARRATDRVLVFGGSEQIPDQFRVPAQRSLRRSLGGTVTSINVRMAAKWIELAGSDELHSLAARDKFRLWATDAVVEERFDRQSLTDEQVIDLIRQMLAQDAGMPRTRALRQLRSTGLACEQKRFSGLYAQVVAKQ